ncbi:hypothetical protein E9993_04900 [Labilibacter sediminis]|nr:hypothetical protein E9993_04900 [Labilibacter sediminis]
MMANSNDIQQLLISSENWTVALKCESWGSGTITDEIHKADMEIELSQKGVWDSILELQVSHKQDKKTCIVKGIQGSTYLHAINDDNEGQSVKIDSDNLILSLGINFISIDLNNLKLNWKLEPDMAEVFEFYDLEGDYLLRGEVGIHRIDKLGNIKWTFTSQDIWVNMEGRPEVTITDSTIKLLDFNSYEYEINFNGKLIEN